MEITKKDLWMMGLAFLLAERSDCKSRHVGAIITNEKHHILGTGYNGTVTGAPHCSNSTCVRLEHKHINVHDGCMAVHAEMNALIQSKSKGTRLYSTTFPCSACLKTMLNFGINKIFYCEPYPDTQYVVDFYFKFFKSYQIKPEEINMQFIKFLEKRIGKDGIRKIYQDIK